ncbi:MAG: SRPBCC domain-containing protein [Bacteroidales bacterium]|nr:SRPBCC domain-containing protein [Bacteroidales bacterium]
MNVNLEVTKIIEIKADSDTVWDAITNPDKIKVYFFGTEVVTDWKVGSPLIFQGEFDGHKYMDKGNILVVEPGNLLKYNYWSSFSGLEDKIENYSIVTYQLKDEIDQTTLSLNQKGFANDQALEHAQNAWQMVLQGLKDMLENV